MHMNAYHAIMDVIKRTNKDSLVPSSRPGLIVNSRARHYRSRPLISGVGCQNTLRKLAGELAKTFHIYVARVKLRE